MLPSTIWANNMITAAQPIVPVRSTMNVKGDRLDHVLPANSIQVIK
jgi:hypothetical protein